MGLDMMAGWADQPEPRQQANVVAIEEPKIKIHCEFEWRKHARLQQFMVELWHKRKEEDTPYGVMDSDFNCEDLELFEEDIKDLKKKVEDNNLPFCSDGFFWGHQFQEEAMREYKEQDLDFCEKALAWIADGKKVFYSCWW